jgi:hypothetical protein
MRTAALLSGTTAAALLLLTPTAVAEPANNPTQVHVPVDCEGSSATLLMHPGLGKGVWDISTEDVSNSPDFLIQHIFIEFYVNGEFQGDGHFDFGKKTGQTDRTVCDTTESFVDGAGNQLLAVGWVSLIAK